MPVLNILTPNTVDNDMIRQVFSMMEKGAGAIPDTLGLLANSPGLFEKQAGLIAYYGSHPRLGPELLSLIRYTAAVHFNNHACIEFNSTLLKKQGMTDRDLEEVLKNPLTAPLEQKDQLLLAFVCKSLKSNNAACHKDMEALRAAGWQAGDILDGVYLGFFMFAPGQIMQLFQQDAYGTKQVKMRME